MNKDVLLSIRGLHYIDSDEDSEPIEVICPAEYYYRNDKHYIIYHEPTEDNTETVKVTVKISDSFVDIKKAGAYSSDMSFERGQKKLSCYSTPFGTLMIATVTRSIDLQVEESKLSLKIDYLLEANYEPVSDCTLELQITEKDPSLFSLDS